MVFFAVYALATPLAVGLAINPKLVAVLAGPNAAAWVQAIGSMAAIVASAGIAIWVDRREVRRQRDERAADWIERLQVLCDLADDAVVAAEEAKRDLFGDLQWVAHNGIPGVRTLNEIATVLEQVEVRSLNSAAAHRCWLHLLWACQAGSHYEDGAVRDWHSDGHLNPDSGESIADWPGRVAGLRDQLVAMRDEKHR